MLYNNVDDWREYYHRTLRERPEGDKKHFLARRKRYSDRMRTKSPAELMSLSYSHQAPIDERLLVLNELSRRIRYEGLNTGELTIPCLKCIIEDYHIVMATLLPKGSKSRDYHIRAWKKIARFSKIQSVYFWNQMQQRRMRFAKSLRSRRYHQVRDYGNGSRITLYQRLAIKKDLSRRVRFEKLDPNELSSTCCFSIAHDYHFVMAALLPEGSSTRRYHIDAGKDVVRRTMRAYARFWC